MTHVMMHFYEAWHAEQVGMMYYMLVYANLRETVYVK